MMWAFRKFRWGGKYFRLIWSKYAISRGAACAVTMMGGSVILSVCGVVDDVRFRPVSTLHMLRLPVPIGKLVGNFNFVSADLLAARRIPRGFQSRVMVWKSLGPDIIDAVRKSTVMLIDMINNCHESLLLQALERRDSVDVPKQGGFDSESMGSANTGRLKNTLLRRSHCAPLPANKHKACGHDQKGADEDIGGRDFRPDEIAIEKRPDQSGILDRGE